MLIYLRSAVFLLWLIVTVIPWSLVAVLASAFTRGAPLYWLCAGWLKVAILGAQWICGVHWRVQGMEHVPTAADGTASVILVPKHQSTWETFAFPALMPHPLAYVFKRELLYIPFFGWAIGRLDMVHINRGRGSDAWRKVVEQGTRIMAQGTWMIMFPEGTRTPRGSQGEYKSGASRLAVTTKTPLVPIAVTSARCWPRKSFLLRPGTIDISIGRPIHPQGRRPDDLMREVEAWIESEMRRLDPEAYTTPQG
ncbi:1-acyl-sn-glycerol-3-phosphate acyltransferase [Sphaerotilus montanus]|jgi:1-acyl-sn-glycerol-3-phosphate acyltransferase|uniref:1-acyl-sn-glycerol-3-phosphate acyltransferase n=1 Tax=Sphaerotilus montanus TaxID=522889 RepID=A0A7Y9QYW1_9BURK|nr:lysophospholipid acyltransferase family protein [Sphaerotilus montanus]NYG32105.1 1-acyl-sn-glycerol-3-phosphate acyltransferase [Sphaerotilus montanus]NZD57958.1 1-acyl-sn-glycerol-3-phosphate acyltransferase [Sphaerotilus montanus]